MHITFRPLLLEEVALASQLVDAAYAPQVREIYGDSSPLRRWRHYDESKIESYLAREAEGVRGGFWKRQLVTFNVCRSYGSFGWFHTLAVHPEFQSRGLGKLAVADAESYLNRRGVTAVALMTWPQAIKNLAFYQRMGYRLAGLSVYAYRPTDTPVIRGESPFYAQRIGRSASEDMNRAEAAIKTLCQHVFAGLDYTSLIAWAQQQHFAETLLLWRDGSLRALALFYFFPNAHWAEGKMLLLHPSLSLNDQLWVLEHLRLWSRLHQRTAFGAPVDLSGDFARTALLPQGFRLFPESMANFFKGDDMPDPSLHFIRFGG